LDELFVLLLGWNVVFVLKGVLEIVELLVTEAPTELRLDVV
jgi:hypothetical protein